jgi:hypothetical protein
MKQLMHETKTINDPVDKIRTEVEQTNETGHGSGKLSDFPKGTRPP